MNELTTKQRAFVESYLRCWNASQAARDAGYKGKRANQQGQDYLSKPDIQAVIAARLTEMTMSADEVLARLSFEARGSMADFLRIDEEEVTLTWSLLSVPETKDGKPDIPGVMLDLAMQENVKPTDRILHTATIKRSVARLDLMEAGQRGQLGLIKEYSLDDKGKVTIKLYDAQNAKIQIGKHHKLFTDQVEHSGSVDIKGYTHVSPDDWDTSPDEGA